MNQALPFTGNITMNIIFPGLQGKDRMKKQSLFVLFPDKSSEDRHFIEKEDLKFVYKHSRSKAAIAIKK